MFYTTIIIALLYKACALSSEMGSEGGLYLYDNNLQFLFLSLESIFFRFAPRAWWGRGWRTIRKNL